MKKFIVLILIICSSVVSFSQRRPKEPTKLKTYDHSISFSYQSGSASGFYDLNGGFITTIWDSTTFYDTVNKEFIHREFIFELQKTTFELAFNYKLAPNIYLKSELPFSIYNLSEKYLTKFIYDSLGRQIGSLSNAARESKTMNKIDYISVGGVFVYTLGNFNYAGSAELQIPFGGESGQLDSSISFLSDGAFATIFGAYAGYDFSKIKLGLAAKYYLRTEDFKNQIQGTFTINYESVEGTFIRGFIDIVRSTDSFENTKLLYYGKDVVQEDYIAFGFGSRLLLGSDYFAEFDYTVRTSGRNSLNYNNFRMIVGYSF